MSTFATGRLRRRTRNYVRSGLLRLRQTYMAILQCGVAAGLAYYLLNEIMGHDRPFFAPMAAVIVLSASIQGRVRRSVELVIGVAIGVGAGDVFVSTFGTGALQMIIMVWISLVIATLIDKSPLVYTQAALGAVLIATILPPGSGGGIERMFDAFMGGLVGIVIAALIPSSPLKKARLEVSRVLDMTATVLENVAQGLKNRDGKLINDALKDARGSQAAINVMLLRAQEEEEQIAVSPLLWRHHRRLTSLQRILNPVDNAMRNTRVLARRAVLLAEDDDEVSHAQITIIEELADIAHDLSKLYTTTDDIDKGVAIPELTKRLRHVGRQLDEDIVSGNVLSAVVIFAQTRSITVDLLVICGMSRQSALATLIPTSKHPGVPSEIAHRAEHIRAIRMLDADPDRPATVPMAAIRSDHPAVEEFSAVKDNGTTSTQPPKTAAVHGEGDQEEENVHDSFDDLQSHKSKSTGVPKEKRSQK
ncbi:MAG: FUSC family protein [Corynebacterium sp.]|nr:FUSC family protein [Corynebacterium sp.]